MPTQQLPLPRGGLKDVHIWPHSILSLRHQFEHHHWKVDVWRQEALETVVREKEEVVRGEVDDGGHSVQ